MSDRKAQLARQFIEAIPHSRALGMQLTEIGDGVAPPPLGSAGGPAGTEHPLRLRILRQQRDLLERGGGHRRHPGGVGQ